jgi:hypothetical protein
MRSRLLSIALLPLFVLALALPAHADPMDDFTITGGGATIDFSLPASTTQPCCGLPDQFNFGQVSGTVNGVNQFIGVNFITGSGCAVCHTILLSYPSTNWTLDLPPLYGITYSGTIANPEETLTFIPGDYTTQTFGTLPPFASFDIKVTPETAATPEPAAFLFLITAALGLPLVKRRRAATS